MKKETGRDRYDFGRNVITHKDKKITTSLNTNFEKLLTREIRDSDFKLGTVKSYIEFRPDTVSDIFYDTPFLWWYFLTFNNIKDPFEGLNAGEIIIIPNLNVV